MAKAKLIVVTGPTASGKSSFALALAQELGGELVSADSMQVYRLLDIGTAKPTLAEQAAVPHHLIDVVDPDEPFHVGRFRAEAAAAVAGIVARGRVPIVVGGTALYLKALLRGLAEGPPADPRLRAELVARWEGGERSALRDELAACDPDLAARLHPNDRARLLRGLEVWRAGGEPLSALQKRHGFSGSDYDSLVLGTQLDRDALYRRIDERATAMVEAGWLDEVRAVLDRGFSPALPSLRALGYRQLCDHLVHGRNLGEAVEEIQRETRRFAKRQLTWFRKMPVFWVASGEVSAGLARAKNFLQTGVSPI